MEHKNWKLKTADGNIYGPVDTATMREWIKDDKVSADDYIQEEDKGLSSRSPPPFPLT